MLFKFTNVMKHKVRYAESGSDHRNVLLIHGLGGSAESWIHNIDVFGKRFHIYAPDLLGFGESDKPSIKYDMKLFTKFIDRFTDTVGIKKASLIGSSLGGQIAAEFALSYPKKINKLVLVSPAGIPPKEFKGTLELKRYAKVLDAKNVKDVRDALTALDSNGSSVTDEYVNNVYSYVTMQGTRHAFISSLQGSVRASRLANRLNSIKAKTFVIWGKKDNLIPVKYCEPFITKMKNCRLLIIEECGHRPHAEKPRLFNNSIIDFLEES